MSTYGLERPRLPQTDTRGPAPGAKGPWLRPPGRPVLRRSPSDATLVARVRTGDVGAFEAIFRRYQPPLLSYCRHVLGNQAEAEDALQQAFIRVHRAITAGSPPRELRPWLYTIARNCCLSAIACRRPSARLDDREPSIDGLSDTVSERADLRELVADVQALPEDQRSALLLAELGDLSHEQIADVVNCPAGKVKALIHQARTTLIAQREARAASCEQIRAELSIARGGELRRGPLRRHLGLCAGCRDFAAAIRTQRSSLAVVLPVLPTAGFASRVLGHAAAGTATAGATGAGVAGGHAAAVIAGGAGSGGGAVSGAAAIAAGSVSSSTGAAGVGAAVGTGLAAKLAIGGAVAVIASAGAAATFHRAPTPPRRAPIPVAAAGVHQTRPTSLASRGAAPAGTTRAAVVARAARHRVHHPRLGVVRKTQLTTTGTAAARRKTVRSGVSHPRTAAARRRRAAARPLRKTAAGTRLEPAKTAGSTRRRISRSGKAAPTLAGPAAARLKAARAKLGRPRSARAGSAAVRSTASKAHSTSGGPRRLSGAHRGAHETGAAQRTSRGTTGEVHSVLRTRRAA